MSTRLELLLRCLYISMLSFAFLCFSCVSVLLAMGAFGRKTCQLSTFRRRLIVTFAKQIEQSSTNEFQSRVNMFLLLTTHAQNHRKA